VDVSLWQNNTQVAAISTGVGSGRTAYTVPSAMAAGSYELRVTSEDDSRVVARQPIQIMLPTVTITSPQSGADYYTGDHLPITWTYNGPKASLFTIGLWQQGHSTSNIIQGASNMATFPIPISFAEGAYEIRVTSQDNPQVEGRQPIKILPSSVTITDPCVAPNNCGIPYLGESYTILWRYKGDPGPLKLVLLDGSSIVQTISTSTSCGANGSGSFAWRPSICGAFAIQAISATDGTKKGIQPTYICGGDCGECKKEPMLEKKNKKKNKTAD
jgi:hypothetical protein